MTNSEFRMSFVCGTYTIVNIQTKNTKTKKETNIDWIAYNTTVISHK